MENIPPLKIANNETREPQASHEPCSLRALLEASKQVLCQLGFARTHVWRALARAVGTHDSWTLVLVVSPRYTANHGAT